MHRNSNLLFLPLIPELLVPADSPPSEFFFFFIKFTSSWKDTGAPAHLTNEVLVKEKLFSGLFCPSPWGTWPTTSDPQSGDAQEVIGQLRRCLTL